MDRAPTLSTLAFIGAMSLSAPNFGTQKSFTRSTVLESLSGQRNKKFTPNVRTIG